MGYVRGPRRRGVANPVTVTLPLNGIAYFSAGQALPEERLFMDCRLALALIGMADTLKARGITGVEQYGVYEFRCIAGTDPCILSQHARATAIDLHEFRAEDGTTYNVEDDWLINYATPTCSSLTLFPKDAFLHELACEWDSSNVFNIILTPNFNTEHRNHFHVDLTPGKDVIR